MTRFSNLSIPVSRCCQPKNKMKTPRGGACQRWNMHRKGEKTCERIQDVDRFGTAVRHSAGKRTTLVRFPARSGSPFSSKAVVYGHCIVTLPLTIKEALK